MKSTMGVLSVCVIAAALAGLGSAVALADPAAAPSYGSCAEVRAAGKAPLRTGEPGYAGHLDRDGDGIACETK